MSTTSAPSRLLLLLLVVSFLVATTAQLFQRRVCPTVTVYKTKRECEGIPPKCNSDDVCSPGERCCPTENECALTCQKTVIADGCPIPIDLALLLDSSGSIGRRNWKKVQKFARSVVDIYDISEKGTHLGILMYSTKAVVEISFNKYTGVERNAVNMKRDIDLFKLQRGLTFIDKALLKADKDLFVVRSGMRTNVKKVALVLTDGIQTKDKGPFTPLTIASQPLKDKSVNIYSLGVGADIDVLELIQMATGDDFVFSARNFDELEAKVTEITEAQCKACDQVVDVVYGIPDSSDLGEEFGQIKNFFTKLSDLLTIKNRVAHVGIVRFSDTASMVLKLDSIYDKNPLKQYISAMQPKGNGVDINKAIRVAADHAFTMFGGVRQVVPKTFVVFVPKKATVSNKVIAEAARKLKSIGVRLMFVGVDRSTDQAFYKTVASQPSSRYFVHGFDHAELQVAAFEAADTICKGRYGKCPAFKATSSECPPEPDDECNVDKDCTGAEMMCCAAACGTACTRRVKNCFISMDVALAIDSSAAVSDEAFAKIKKFAINLVNAIADSENSIHVGLVQYGATAKTVVDFNKFVSDPRIREVIQGLMKNNDGTRRVDIALETVKNEVFSLEGGMRQGRPRYVIFITGGDTDPASKDLAEASKALRGLNVNIIALGIDSGVNHGFLNKLASDPSFVYSSASVDSLATPREKIEAAMCNAKPGKCPVPIGRGRCDDPTLVPQHYIPCGPSVNEASSKANDWVCPGEQKCCLDMRDACYSVCSDPPNECRGQYDLTLLLESSDDVGADGFNKVKSFAKEFIRAFTVSDHDTRVSVITYGGPSLVHLKLNGITNADSQKVAAEIDKINFRGGPGGAVDGAIRTAISKVYTSAGGSRDHANKSLVIIGSGKLQNAEAAAALANQLRQNQVDVFVMPVGGKGDIAGLKTVASKQAEKNVFVTTTYDALTPHLRALTKTVCDGAEKLKVCKLPLDIVFGIPTSTALGKDFEKIKNSFTSLLRFFKVSNRLAHLGIVQYSDDATYSKSLNDDYSRTELMDYINNLRPSGTGFNVQAALKRAADHAFTIYGGVRQTVPKTFVLFVPREATSAMNEIRQTAKTLKSMGVQIVVFGVDQVPNLNDFKRIASAPRRKFFFGNTYDKITGSVYNAKETICKGRYGKCPPVPPDQCAAPTDTCEVDGNCKGINEKCCEGSCGRKCSQKEDNCFINMDVAIAIDNSNAVSGEDLTKVKNFVKSTIDTFATSENSIHFSLINYAETAEVKSTFRSPKTEGELKALVDGIAASNQDQRRLDVAFSTIKNNVFSLEGGMRQGNPRFVLFLTGGASNENFEKEAKELKAMDGMNVIAVGVNSGVPDAFLKSLATANNLVFKASSPDDLAGLKKQIEKVFCKPKPGTCPPAPTPTGACPAEVPEKYIPCGRSAGKSEDSDWPCPGEEKCCKDPETGCHSVCRKAPNECKEKHDLTLLLESDDSVGATGFNKVKTFAKQLVDAFDISDSRTKVSVITYGAKPQLNFQFNTFSGVTKDQVKSAIDKIGFQGGGVSSTANALEMAFNEVYKVDAGSRKDAKKSLVIISQGKFQNPSKAARFSSQLIQNNVDVFAIPIGGREDLQSLRRVASKKQDKTVFITSSYDALKPHLRAVTKRICEEAVKLIPCDRPLDIVYGIPVASDLGGDLSQVKTLFSSLTRRFKVNNRNVHIGLIPYSDTASLETSLDVEYDPYIIQSKIKALKPRGSGYNVAKAITVAADYAFTVFGGTRQTSPKTFVLMVPGPISGDSSAIVAAAKKLKGMGVRLMIFGLDGNANKPLLGSISTQPMSKFLLFGNYDDLIVATEPAADTICAGKYGKCFEVPRSSECPGEPKPSCSVDSDCQDAGQACCIGECSVPTCLGRVQNCFVNMDIALAFDTTLSGRDLDSAKAFTKRFISSIADSENSIHFGLLSFGSSAQTLANFRNFAPLPKLKTLVDGITSSSGDRRVDLALRGVKSDIFSLEGGMRHGHPKFAIFLTSGATSADSEDLAKASKDLRALGVNVVAIASNSGVDDTFLGQLASDPKYIFKANAASDLNDLVGNIVGKLCNAKPGSCPAVTAACTAPGSAVPAEYIPCGDSAGKAGRSDKENDWDCPGEQRCCRDPSGCHSICRHPPNVCKGQYDLVLLLDSSAEVGERGFQKVKTFAKQLVDAFDISDSGTHVSVVSYSGAPNVDIKFNQFVAKDQIKGAIDAIPFQGGGPSATAEALRSALSNVYTISSGARDRVNKSLVIISPGKFQNPASAISLAGQLKLKQVDVFAIPVGNAPDLPSLRKIVSRLEEKNVFMTTSPDALLPHLRAVTNTICEGAQKIKVCDQVMDVVFGIPTAKKLGNDFQKVKDFYMNMVKLFKVSNRKVHVGLIPYSTSASMTAKLDSIYDRSALLSTINNLKPSGSGYNVEAALRVAADHAFSIFGGVRQTAPKTFVLFVPGDSSSSQNAVNAAAQKLKSMGVRLMIIELKDAKAALYRLAASQPSSKHHLTGGYDDIGAGIYDAADTICKAKYGKCPAFRPPTPAECPPDVESTCAVDKDCKQPEEVCCIGGCGESTCRTRVKNCFVAMDIAIAVDSTAGISDDDFENTKKFVTRIVNSNSDSENNIHYGLLQFGQGATTLTNFRQYVSEAKLRDLIKNMQKTGDSDRRVDVALRGIKSGIFSLEGGMRQGRPRFAIVVTSGASSADSEDLAKASKDLRDIGVNIIAVGSNTNVDNGFLQQLASDPNFVFKANTPGDLKTLWNDIERNMCSVKPGKCPAVSARCSAPGSAVPAEYIPCGDSAGKAGRSDKENDWDCPGEQRCCRDPSGCHAICREPPNVCSGQFDLTLLLESSNEAGKNGFNKVKNFAKQLVDAFDISELGTKVSVISYGTKPKLDFGFKTISAVTIEKVKEAIDRVKFGGAGASSTADALEMAVKDVYSASGGMRASSKKSLVVISSGKFTNVGKAARLAGQLKQNSVDVFAVPIGDSPDIPSMKRVVSRVIDKNVFMTTSHDALLPHLRALTKTICDGAEKLKVCDTPMDVVYGIPVSSSLGGDFQKIKSFFTSMTKQLAVTNRKVHVGLIPYSSSAAMTVGLDKIYNKDNILNAINNLKPSKGAYNVEAALKVAADHAFTIFGGVRQTAPKTFVLFVPSKASASPEAIRAAVKKLKSVGVRLMVAGLNGVNAALYRTAVTQPPSKHFLYGNYDDIGAKVYDAVDTICKAKYGKCPAYPPAPLAECPSSPENSCDVDRDCKGPEQVCCIGGCGGRTCRPRVRNCFVAMDIAIAVDSTAGISDDDFENTKKFVTRIVNSNSDSENNIHYGLLQFGQGATTLTNFRQYVSEAKLRDLIKNMQKTGDSDRRVDVALRGIKSGIFSLEGGMRQGRPRFAIVVTSGASSADSEDLAKASKDLRDIGVNIIAVGSNTNVDNGFLQQLASDPNFVFKANTPGDLKTLWNDIERNMCSVKPGKCPAVSARCSAPGSAVPAKYIPCGDSAGKAGRSDKENDWDCPGEQRCCRDPSGCHAICREPPNVCSGQFDLTLLLESSNDAGKNGFNKVKNFAKQLVDAFDISESGTKVSVISYGTKPKLDFGFKTISAVTIEKVKEAIDRVQFGGAGASSTADALEMAVKDVYSASGGMRANSKKSLVVISSGKFTNLAKAARLAGQLKQNSVDVFAVPIGDSPDIPSMKRVVSRVIDKNVFMTTSHDALRPHLRALTKTICDGAEKLKVCDTPMDVVYGIPVSSSLGGDFQKIKSFFTSMTKQLAVTNRKVHVGLIPYSSSAAMTVGLDTIYNKDNILNAINNLKPSKGAYNVEAALKVAADHAFTIFGGVRQTAPKTFVLFVPSKASASPEAIRAAVKKLKSVGVRLMVAGLNGVNAALYRTAVTQPPSKHFLYGDYDDIGAKVYDAVDTICKAKYGKCPAYPPAPLAECPSNPENSCDVDRDCKGPEQVCCIGGCGGRTCRPRVRNCFVAMDIAIAVDSTAGISDDDFENTKKFITRIVNSNSDSENNIHYGLLQFGQGATTLTNFRQYVSEAKLRDLIKNMQKTGDSDRRVDVALRGIKSGIFSLEGGMRQGRPRFAIVVTSGASSADSEDLAKASKDLRDIGVNIIAVGSNTNVDNGFLQQLASDPNFVFKANTPGDLKTLWNDIERNMCSVKPGKCPAVSARCSAPGSAVPAKYIPCGDSAGKAGRSDKENDWDCPGEQRCCRDPSGCHAICREPPNVCSGQFDLTLLLESSNDAGKNGFNKVKNFAKQLVDAFDISESGTKVSVISYGTKPKLDFGFKTISAVTIEKVKEAIDRVQFGGAGASSTADALEMAVKDIYSASGGMRASSKKSLVVISSGKFTNVGKAARLAGQLKQNSVDVFAVPIGDSPDIPSMKRVVSRVIDKNVFMTTSHDALLPHLRALTKTICDGAEKLKVCDTPMDVVYGIPVSSSLGGDFQKIKSFFTSMTKQLAVTNRKVHVGLIPYSSSAAMTVGLDKIYNKDNILNAINNLKPSKGAYNVEAALKVAADNAFTIFGGVRQTAPKTFVLFVPSKASASPEDIHAAVKKLKSVGVRLMVAGLNGVNAALYRTAVTQPPSKHFLYGDYDDIGAKVYDAVDTICKAKYGKCPAYPPAPLAECPSSPENSCDVDRDCKGPEQACCIGGCGGRTCRPRVRNCYVTMDIAIAVDASAGVSDGDFEEEKKFVTRIINSISDSENSIHYGLLKFGKTAQTLTNFRQFVSEARLRDLVKNMKKTGDAERRFDVALRTIKSDIFSLEGGMRQGHTRNVIIVTSGATSPNSEDLAKASKDLRALGVNIVAVGVNRNVDDAFLRELASDDRFAFRASSPQELQSLWSRVEAELCSKKPGQCPAVAATCSTPRSAVPAKYIPCGDSAGKAGRSDKENDWDCPGEQRCCRDPSGCHAICREPPNVCKGQYDLTFVIDASNAVGANGFHKVKAFAKQLVDAFDISDSQTHVAVITTGKSTKVDLRFDSLKGGQFNKKAVKSMIDGAAFQGGAVGDVSEGLKEAVEIVYTSKNGAREKARKALVLIGPGKFTNPSKSAALASRLKQNLVDIYAVPVGNAPDLPSLSNVVSRVVEKNVFMTTSHGALVPHLRALTRTICEGAEKIKACDQPLDVVFGIPASTTHRPQLATAKSIFDSMLRQFKVTNRLVHVGLIKYSNNAEMPLHLDASYNRQDIQSQIANLKATGIGVNVEAALKAAADNAFTIFGGVRQTVPKTFVIFVPGKTSVSQSAVKEAATKLKSMGVRLLVLALEEANVALYRLVSSQPPSKYLVYGNADVLGAAVLDAVDTVCRGKYGKCPAFPPPRPAECPADMEDGCAVDKDCKLPEEVCCAGGCGERTCRTRVKNCFVTMDVAIAIDASDGMSDEDFEATKTFATTLVNSLSDSENAIRFGILKYGQESRTQTNFRQFLSEGRLRDMIKKMQKTSDSHRRIDVALHGIKTDIFSLEGGMRQGQPRYAIFLAAGGHSGSSEDLTKASKGLQDLGVNIMAVGVNSKVDQAFLSQLATDDRFVFQSNSAKELPNLWPQIETQMCQEKPGKCAAVTATCTAPGSAVPAEYIPCGDSAGKAGRSDKENDWDCPGEQRCCRDPSGCHAICREPPNVCANLAHDLAFVIESSAAVGKAGFEKAKTFAKNIIDAFDVSPTGTRVSVITYGPTSTVRSRFNSFTGPQLSKDNIKRQIDGIRYQGGSPAMASAALNLAVSDVFTDSSGSREGVNKTLVLIGSGRFQDPNSAVGAAAALKQNLVDVYAVPVGDNPDVASLRKFASMKVEKNVFMTTSYNALKPHVRALTKAICDGAVKIRKCDQPVDVYFGIPVSTSVASDNANIRKMFSSLLRMLEVSNRLVHTGVIRYADSADVYINLDRVYNRDLVESYINSLPLSGKSLNLARALEVAADHGFTIYGGVRQTVPKIFVLYVPGPVSSHPEEIRAAAAKLKSLGVRIVVLGLQKNVDKRLYNAVASQPASKFLLTAESFAGLSLALNAASNRICNAKYGRCPKPPPQPAECPPKITHSCSQDKDCKTAGDLCCQDGCQTRTCLTGVKNCFVPMDVAFAIDVSETVTSADITNAKEFVKEIIRSFADSENDIHFSIMEFKGTAKALTPGFKNAKSEAELRSIIDGLQKTNDPTKRLDLALRTAKKDIFSLEGRVRHGHQRFLVFLVSSESSPGTGNLGEARKPLDEFGVKTVVVAMNKHIDRQFLQQLASENRLIIQADTSEDLEKLRPQLESLFCNEKPGSCPVPDASPDPAVCSAQTEVPLKFIPCGASAKKSGRSQRENDWDCPGEQKCCRDPDTGCHDVCVEPPLACKKVKEIELVVESSDAIGEAGFEKVKEFLQYFSDAFSVSRVGSHIGMIVYASRSREVFRINAHDNPKSLRKGIAKARFRGTKYTVPSNGLITALDRSFTQKGGSREDVNKSVVLFTTGHFDKPDTAISVAKQLRSKLVDVFAVAIGDNPDLGTIRKIVSHPIEQNVFMMSSTDALKAQARALVKRVCEGAEREYVVCMEYRDSLKASKYARKTWKTHKKHTEQEITK